MKPLLLTLLALLVPSCLHPAPAPPVPSDDVVKACQSMQALHCPLGQPTPNGAPCTTWMPRYVAEGLIDAGCVARATSCADADRCGR